MPCYPPNPQQIISAMPSTRSPNPPPSPPSFSSLSSFPQNYTGPLTAHQHRQRGTESSTTMSNSACQLQTAIGISYVIPLHPLTTKKVSQTETMASMKKTTTQTPIRSARMSSTTVPTLTTNIANAVLLDAILSGGFALSPQTFISTLCSLPWPAPRPRCPTCRA